MCENVNLTLNFFESRNTNVISSLLDLNDNVVETLSETEFKWIAGNSLRAHGGFVKKISGDDNFKAYILPNVAKLSFEKLKVSDIKNNDDEFDVSGNNTELTFRLEDKEVVYRLCAESILDVENELPDNDEEQVEEEAEINRGLEGAENANANQVIQEVNENENEDVANVDVPADENENVDVPAEAEKEPKGIFEKAAEYVKNNLSPKKEEEEEEEENTGLLLESPKLGNMSLPPLNEFKVSQEMNAVPANAPAMPPQEMNAVPANAPTMNAQGMNAVPANAPAMNAQGMNAQGMNAQGMTASNNQQSQMLPSKVPEPAMNVPIEQTNEQNPSQPTMAPAMAGGNYYENSIKENFQIGNARTNRNKSKKKKVRRGTSLSKKGRTGVKVL